MGLRKDERSINGYATALKEGAIAALRIDIAAWKKGREASSNNKARKVPLLWNKPEEVQTHE